MVLPTEETMTLIPDLDLGRELTPEEVELVEKDAHIITLNTLTRMQDFRDDEVSIFTAEESFTVGDRLTEEGIEALLAHAMLAAANHPRDITEANWLPGGPFWKG
jgi:hypothetical protein